MLQAKKGKAVLRKGIASTGAVLLLLSGACVTAQNTDDTLMKGFENPPQSARPRVWWHWMNGNITKEGIKLDLEWMHRVGLAGFQNFDAALSTPQVVEKRLAYMTPEWKDAFKYATTLADQLGMEEAIAGSPGWSETGGPWVQPSQGMKKYVWSETLVEGGKPFNGKLAHPPSNTGAFQNVGVRDELAGPDNEKKAPQFYADAAVVAYRRPVDDVSVEALHAKITASAGSPDTAMLTDGDLEKTTKLPIPAAGQDAWIQYEFPQPETIRSVTIATKGVGMIVAMITGIANPERSLEASDDGRNFHTVAKLPDGGAPELTVSFPPEKARFFRVVFKRVPPPPPPAWAADLDPSSFGFDLKQHTPTDYEISELVLHPAARVNRFEEKAAFVPVPDLYEFATPQVGQGEAIAKSDVIDLTSKMSPDGTLDWTPPSGEWVVLRIGYSLLGITNHPATKEATGLEVDKLNHTYVKDYMDHYLDSYKETVGPSLMGKRGIEYVITDSWEAGAQNWTDDILAQFKKRRGYDPTPWLPVLTGQIVESSEASDQFLWDFRKTIADLTADEHYGQVQASLKARGIGHYGESHESGRAFIADGMEVKKLNDIPMSAMWTQVPGVNKEQYGYNADDRESASVAHIYGQNIAAAESLTAAAAPWAWSPATLKPTADQELLNGINRFVIHESAHQPLVDKKPGLTLGPFGQWFNRNETWAEQAGPWVNYLARSSYLLQQGHFVADVIYFYGEDSNLTAIFEKKSPDMPAGYGFDYINADGLIHELSVSDGRITTKSGMNYKLLALDPYSKHMSLPVLRAIYKLVQQGAAVAGEKPTNDPSLADDAAEFKKLNDELFGDGGGVHTVGKGKVYAGQDAGAALKAMNVAPDFDHTKPESDTRIEFVHRRLPNADIYFLDNRSDHDQTVDATFRVTGKAPELLNDELFGDGGGVHTVGKGKVYAGQDAGAALKAMNVAPDFDHTKPESDTRIEFVHRRLPNADIYFLDNRSDHDQTVDATFRVTGKAPELWYAETGKSQPASYRIADRRTTVPLHFGPWGTVFVVFREPAKAAFRTLPKPVESQLATLDGPWNVSFEPGRGAPATATFDKLISWSDSTDAGVKYFSGIGTYTKTIQAPADWFKSGAKLWIDLGDVKNLAVVTVNGKQLGTVWHAPYRVDATSALKPGANEVSIQVINAWVNRLIGDQQPGATKYTFADVKPYKANSPLLPSGLLGPVVIESVATPKP